MSTSFEDRYAQGTRLGRWEANRSRGGKAGAFIRFGDSDSIGAGWQPRSLHVAVRSELLNSSAGIPLPHVHLHALEAGSHGRFPERGVEYEKGFQILEEYIFP